MFLTRWQKALVSEVTDLVSEVNDHIGNPDYYNYEDAIRLVRPAHELVERDKIIMMAMHLSRDNLQETSNLFVEPTYYGYDVTLRGLDVEEFNKAIHHTEINLFYWEELGMLNYWLTLNKKVFVRYIADHLDDLKDSYGELTLLTNPTDLPEDEHYWGNTKILSKEDWDKIDGVEVNDYNCMLWNEVFGYDYATIMNIINELDNSHTRWTGTEDDMGILGMLQEIHDDQEMLAFTLAGDINSIMTNTSLSWDRRYSRCERLLTKIYNNL
jgi:hypothetical protein